MKQTPARIALAELFNDAIASRPPGDYMLGASLVELLDTPEGQVAHRALASEMTKEAIDELKVRLARGMRAFMDEVR